MILYGRIFKNGIIITYALVIEPLLWKCFQLLSQKTFIHKGSFELIDQIIYSLHAKEFLII